MDETMSTLITCPITASATMLSKSPRPRPVPAMGGAVGGRKFSCQPGACRLGGLPGPMRRRLCAGGDYGVAIWPHCTNTGLAALGHEDGLGGADGRQAAQGLLPGDGGRSEQSLNALGALVQVLSATLAVSRAVRLLDGLGQDPEVVPAPGQPGVVLAGLLAVGQEVLLETPGSCLASAISQEGRGVALGSAPGRKPPSTSGDDFGVGGKSTGPVKPTERRALIWAPT